MITIPEIDVQFLLSLNELYGLTTVTVEVNGDVFSKELEDKVASDGEEMEAYYNHLHLMELWAELMGEAKIHGPFKLLISNGEVSATRID